MPAKAFSCQPQAVCDFTLDRCRRRSPEEGQDDEIAKEYQEYLKEAPDSALPPRVKDALAKLRLNGER
jgi:hypothetical protein